MNKIKKKIKIFLNVKYYLYICSIKLKDMKNIYLLPTEEPSRLHGMFNSSELGLSKEPLNCRDARHLYITSDEEIKEGDYALNPSGKRLKIVSKNNEGYYETTLVKGHYFKLPKCKKIILTTDPELISNGIQSVDDDFLKWFVNDSHHEFVEYDKSYNRGNGNYYYKIITPTVKNEPISNSYLQVFIDQFSDGKRAELNPIDWNALEFLDWLKLNNFDIVKKK